MNKRKPTLAEAHPELAAQWHPTKNGDLKPDMVTCGSGKGVWWLLSYDDPDTGKCFNFEWQDSVDNRVKGNGCPYLSGKAVQFGFNDLLTKRPDLATEWHPTKNGDLKPEMITCGSAKKVWWFLRYEDPKTGKHYNFEWQAIVHNRVNGCGCPYLTNQAVWKGFNDLATTRPELTTQWHPTKNGKLTPDMITCGSNKKVWWICEKKHEWETTVNNRNRGTICPVCAKRRITPGVNSLATTHPELASQWHPTKNRGLTAEMVSCWSDKDIWWYYPYNDPETGKHFEFVWKANILSRMKEEGCPYLSGMAVWPGYNDLATKRPDLVKEWHPTKNKRLTPDKVTCGSRKKVWWYLPYDDPETGKHFDFAWKADVISRVKGVGCPYISGKAVWSGYNDLATNYPELAKEWHPTMNGELTPNEVTCDSGKKVWWYLPYDDPETGKHFEFVWAARVFNRTSGADCPFLSGKAVWLGYNDLATNSPELAKEWHPTKNRRLTPDMVTCGSGKKVWWYLPYDDPETGKHFDFCWAASISNRTNGAGCPFLAGKAAWSGYNDLETKSPELAKEWHPTKNRKRTPNQVNNQTMMKVWWLCPKCGYEWRSSVRARAVDESGCPRCRKETSKYI